MGAGQAVRQRGVHAKKGLMQCTDACTCKGCTNRRQAEEESESESDSLQDSGEDSEDSDDL